MRCLVVEELKKLRTDKKNIFGVIGFSILCCVLSYAVFRLGENPNVYAHYGKEGVNMYFFCGLGLIVGLFCSMFLGYNILTKEYINDTWDLLMTKLFDGKKLVISKYVVFLLYQSIYGVLTVALYYPITKYFLRMEPDCRMWYAALVFILFTNVFGYALQFCMQLYIKSFPMAVIFGVLIMYLMGIMAERLRFIRYFSQYASVYLFESGNVFNAGMIAGITAFNIFISVALVYVCGRKFYS